VTGVIHAGDPTSAQAQLDLTTAYNDAAGRTVGAIAVAGNLGGLTLTPGLYKSTSSLEISSGDLTLDAQGDPTAVFIFQMASTLTTTVSRQVILVNGAKAANIYWQVGSSATLGTLSVVKGNILALASITVTTGAAVEGRLLARTGAVTLDSNVVGLAIPSDTTAPTVSSTYPVNAVTGVAINTKITAAFSEAMDPSTITTTTFTVKQGTTPVAGTVTYAGVTATFAPSVNLAANTIYTATITTGATDLAGNLLASSYSWSFTTAVTADTTAPTVTFTVPANAATGVPINLNISATFSEAMDPLTMTTATFTLKQGTTALAGAVTYAVVGTTATFNPATDLAPLTTFTATITTGAKDLAGNLLLNNFAWTFTTGAAPDTNRPTVIATVPANAATGVAINQTINATFSEPMDPLTISTADLLVTGPGTTPVVGTVAYDVVSKIATFLPASNLAQNTIYRATITTGVKDLAHNALASNFVWNFATAATTAGQSPVALGTATTFAVLAGSTVTSTGATAVNGDLGVSPGTGLTGAPTVNGTTHLGDPAAAQAQLDLTTAYNDAAGRTVGAIGVAGNLGGQTLTPGLYKSTSSLEISSGDLTLDAQGDANAVFIFQMASTLTTTSGRQVILSGGAKAANIFWQVGSSATLGTTSVFKGNILALTSITLTTGATVEGRLLARNGAVTLDSNTVGFFTTTSAATGILQSAALPTEPYTDAPGQSLDLATKTITVPLSGSMQFYRIRSTTALTITSITISGGNVVITYN
jgi:tetrahydromethanopterin S-methyltransferase subunit B